MMYIAIFTKLSKNQYCSESLVELIGKGLEWNLSDLLVNVHFGSKANEVKMIEYKEEVIQYLFVNETSEDEMK